MLDRAGKNLLEEMEDYDIKFNGGAAIDHRQ